MFKGLKSKKMVKNETSCIRFSDRKISYHTTPLFNGNIAETFWKTSTDNVQRKYDYKYDDLNRLLQADYSKQGNTEFNSYLEHLTYDKNGNIQTLLRNGNMDTDGMQFANPIDELTYVYDNNNKNRLLSVSDATTNPQGFKDGINSGDDYTYDANGNMTRDDNKGITNITYNHLNLPVIIYFADDNKIAYLYNATGQKVSKKVIQATNITNTDYLSGFQYKNNVLQFFPHAEGYVNATQNELIGGGTSYTFNYVYNYTDHLGNIRLSYSQDPSTNVLKVIEENHYYPFGLKHTGYNSDQMMYIKEEYIVKIKPKPALLKTSYDKKFNGKSWETDLSLNSYDFHARGYMPDIVRTFQQDPKSEEMRRWSPYSFFFDNPMRFVDPDGMKPVDWFKNKEGRIVWFDDKSKSFNDSKNNTWTNIGSTKQDVMKHLNVPTSTKSIEWNTISAFLFDGEDRGGKTFSSIAPVVFNNTAKVSYDLNIKGTEQPFEQLVSGKSEVSGIDVNVMLSSETWAPGTSIQNVSGFFGIKSWTPTGNKFTLKSDLFETYQLPMLSNAPYHSTSTATMNLSLGTYKRLTNSSTGFRQLDLNFNTQVSTKSTVTGESEVFNTNN